MLHTNDCAADNENVSDGVMLRRQDSCQHARATIAKDMTLRDSAGMHLKQIKTLLSSYLLGLTIRL